MLLRKRSGAPADRRPQFSRKLEDWQQVGADYAMYPADPEKKIVKRQENGTLPVSFHPEK